MDLSEEDIKRFWSKVDKKGEDECWAWNGAKTDGNLNYGLIGSGIYVKNSKGGKTSFNLRAHRISYVLHKEDIPDKIFVCHHCDNPECTNPKHLFLGTAKDNNLDMANKKRAANPPFKGGWNKKEWTEENIKLLGTMPDYQLSEIIKISKHTIQKERIKRKISSYAEQTGNTGKFGDNGRTKY